MIIAIPTINKDRAYRVGWSRDSLTLFAFATLPA